MLICGLTGFAGSGKDTAYLELIGAENAAYIPRVAFADPLKADLKICEYALRKYIPGFNISYLDCKNKFRPMWVLWSRVFKLFDPMIWVKRAEERIEELKQKNFRNLIITDVRYAFEIDFILRRGGVVYYIDRPGVGPFNEEEFMSFFDIFTEHPSIVSDPIHNDGSKEYLGQQLYERINNIDRSVDNIKYL